MNDITIEKEQLFSRSYLWQLQREYFQQQGIAAWQQGEVPHYITSNPAMAKAYAEMIFCFMRDRVRLYPQNKQRIYLVELGAGSGRLAYHLLTHLQRLCKNAAFQVPCFTYILTDLAQSNINFWKNHQKLKPFETEGLLDYARFDAVTDDEIAMQVSGVTLKRSSIEAPLFLIANYFFDSIPQALFYINDKKLHEAKLSLYLPGTGKPVLPAEILQDLDIAYSSFEVQPYSYYTNPGFNSILEHYTQSLQNTWLLFADGAIQCLENIQQLSTGGFILLSADKGTNRLEELDNCRQPLIAKHGSFSLSVNYHSIKTYFERQGAVSLFTKHHYSNINIGCIMMLKEPGDYKELLNAYNKEIECFGPDDFFRIKKHFEQYIFNMNLWQIKSYIRLSGYDAHFFKQCVPCLLELVGYADEREIADMHLLINQVWAMYYPIGEEQDLAFDIGLLLYEMSLYNEALEFFNTSLTSYAALSAVYYNIAACYFKLEEDVRAVEYIKKSLELSPQNPEAQALERELEKLYADAV